MRRVFSLIRLEGFLFLTLACLETAHLLYLITSRRVVTHDTLNYLFFQYYFFNNAAVSGEIAQWMPQLLHGTPAAFWQSILSMNGILASALLPVAMLLKGVNFLPIFYAGILFDRFLLLTGTWFLSRRYFSSPLSVFFVSAAMMFSCLWMTQFGFNFHLYYAIPLLLYLGHAFLDSGQWRYPFGAVSLVAVQTMGGNAYFLPVISLTVFLYFLFYGLANGRDAVRFARRLRWDLGFAGFLAGTALTALALWGLFSLALDEDIVFASLGRGRDAGVDLETFLAYGGNTHFIKWLGLFLPFSVDVNCSLYIGVLTLPFLFLALTAPNRKSFAILAAGGILLLFSLGTSVSVFFYHFWPGMFYFRHISLVSPIVRMFLCLSAGFGLESILKAVQEGGFSKSLRYKMGAAVFVCLTVGMFFVVFVKNARFLEPFFLNSGKSAPAFQFIVPQNIDDLILRDSWPAPVRATWALLALAPAVIILLLRGGHRVRTGLVAVLLAGHILTGYGYMFAEGNRRTFRLSRGEMTVLEFRRMPFMRQRPIFLDRSNPRWVFPQDMQDVPRYISVNAFLFYDQLGTSVKVEFWLKPLDELMRAYSWQAFDDSSGIPAGIIRWKTNSLNFPIGHVAARKFSGLDEEKIQFFSRAYFFADASELAAKMAAQDYLGDMLFLSARDGGQRPEAAAAGEGDLSLSQNQRMKLSYKVDRFDANHFDVTVRNPSPDPVWMIYSDVWHPWWKAFVNGREVPVYRANLAYKAVALEPGENSVRFYFHSRLLEWLLRLMGLQALAWVMLVLWWMMRIATRSSLAPGPASRS